MLDEESGAAAPAAIARVRAPRTALALGLFIPVLAIGLYALLGNRDALSPQAIASAPPAAAASDSEVEAMVEMLAKRLETMAGQPGELEGWVLLARTYGAMQRFAEADRAYERAIALAPQEAQLYADRADMVAMKQGRSLSGLPMQLVGQALKIDPNNLKALVLAGSEAFERADYAAAGTYWTRARVNLPADSELAANLDSSLAEVRARTGGAALQVAAASAPAAPAQKPAQEAPLAAGAAASISGVVSLAPALAAKVSPERHRLHLRPRRRRPAHAAGDPPAPRLRAADPLHTRRQSGDVARDEAVEIPPRGGRRAGLEVGQRDAATRRPDRRAGTRRQRRVEAGDRSGSAVRPRPDRPPTAAPRKRDR